MNINCKKFVVIAAASLSLFGLTGQGLCGNKRSSDAQTLADVLAGPCKAQKAALDHATGADDPYMTFFKTTGPEVVKAAQDLIRCEEAHGAQVPSGLRGMVPGRWSPQ
ncbi:MAG: hypothetical protein AB7S81_00360 [Bdellovibrionales bacterium]